MPSVDSEGSRDRELVLKHQHSFSDSGRASVPMWDSSDPDRAPPPLPLNPGTNSPVTKSKTSANITAAAEALAAKSRESLYTTNPSPPKSPDKNLLKGQYHKRMQSMTTNGTVKDLSAYLENARTPDRSPERSPDRSSRNSTYDIENRSPERSPTRSGTPTPGAKDFGKDLIKDMPNLRPTSRPAPKAILGESSPTSATMLALQNTPSPSRDIDTSLANITNGSFALMRPPHTFDAISTQIHSLTSIATNLQREMAQLSRRSKDNATDLISLKEATNARDEDIRASLRELVTGLANKTFDLGPDADPRRLGSYARSPGSFLLDSKAHTSPNMAKSISLPRIPSPASFAATIEREIAGSPSLYSTEGTASIAMMEKILREMATKEGQERLSSSLAQLRGKSTGKESDTIVVQKLEEILKFLRDNDQALVTSKGSKHISDEPPKLELDFDRNLPLARKGRDATPYNSRVTPQPETQLASPRGASMQTEELQEAMKKVKDSVAASGGMTGEIKALLKDLRGEVLGMGREIGRKLEQAESNRSKAVPQGPGREDITLIVEEGLSDLKEHLDRMIGERHQAAESSAMARQIDPQEVYHMVKSALAESALQQRDTVQESDPGLQRDEILDTVREAWENYKPEIELQNFGLERDEILQCLKEGLQDYKPQNDEKELSGASYEEVLEAVQEGLKHFKIPPPIQPEPTITREAILSSVRECLECFEFPAIPLPEPKEPEITREEVLEAIKEGLSAQAPVSRELDFNRDDLFDAVRAGIESAPSSIEGVGVQVLDKMQDLIDGMRTEFKQYSSANGRDTEQVLDAVKDGLEELRAGIETYVDRAADVTGKDEIIDTVKDGLEHLRIDLEGTIGQIPQSSGSSNSAEILDSLEKEFEHLRQTLATSMLRNASSSLDKDEILDALRDGIDELKGSLRSGDSAVLVESINVMRSDLEHLRESMGNTLVTTGSSLNREEILDVLRDGLEGIRLQTERHNDRPESILSNTSELIDTFQDGLNSLRVDLEKIVNKPTDMTVNYEILDTLKDGLAGLRADIDRIQTRQAEMPSAGASRGGEVVIADAGADEGYLRRHDINNLEVLISQLRIKVEALDNMPPPPPPEGSINPAEVAAVKEGVDALNIIVLDLQATVTSMAEKTPLASETAATKEDTEAIETLLRNTKAQLDEIVFPELDGMARTEHLNSIEESIKGAKEVVEDLALRLEDKVASKDDVGIVEVLVKEMRAGVEEMIEIQKSDEVAQRLTKTDLENLETLCAETKTQLAELNLPDAESIATKTEIEALSIMITDFKDTVEGEASLTAQAFDARKIEHGGIADKIEEVKNFLADIREELKLKSDAHVEGIDGIAKSLETTNETIAANDAAVVAKEILETINREFDRVHGNHESYKLEVEQSNATLFEKHEEHKGLIISDLSSKLDGCFDEIMTKYDDAQHSNEVKAAELAEKATKQTQAFERTQAVADELKSLVDTLGTTMTDTCDRMGEDSKTVFERVDDIGSKLDGSVTTIIGESKEHHQSLRGEISKVLVAVEGVQAHSTEYSPKILDAISDVLNIIGHHFEQSQRSSEEIKLSVNAIPAAIPLLPAITAAAALPSPTFERELAEPVKYDDTAVHEKLDRLVEHVSETFSFHSNVDQLEKLQSQIAANTAAFEDFVRSQQTSVAEVQQSRVREAEELAIAIEKRIAQRENVEADVVRLSTEKAILVDSVEDLRASQKDLLSQKSRLQADLSSLETALQIRREEMQIMEARAESLEKRVLEGVLDHSRALLITAARQPVSMQPPNLKNMDKKRVISTASNATSISRASSVATTVPSPVRSAVSSGVGMALNRRKPALEGSRVGSTNNNRPNTPKGDRRILSLSTISGNKGASGFSDRAMILANPNKTSAVSAFGNGGLKRSHSVKSNFPSRKTSWGGTKQIGMYPDHVAEEGEEKENSVLEEREEDDMESVGTERRGSIGDRTITESEIATETDRATSYTGPGAYTRTNSYMTGTGSSVSGTDYGEDRHSAYGDSTVGTLGLREEQESEVSDEVMPEEETMHVKDLVTTSEDHNQIASTDHQSFESNSIHEDEDFSDSQEGDSVVTASESQVSSSVSGPMATQSEVDDLVSQALGLYNNQDHADLQRADDCKDGDGHGHERDYYGAPTDSGIGTDLPTAALEGRMDYFDGKKG